MPRRRALDTPPTEGWDTPLTEEEKRVLKLLVVGRTGKEMAAELAISPEMVRGHVQDILVKLGVHSRLEAAARSMRPNPPLHGESHAMVSLQPITDANREAVEALAVKPDQERFVSGVRESILEAAEEPDAQALYWAIYAEETPVGFVMIADEVGSPDYIAHRLWKLLIDERYQRQGFGTATLDLIVEYFWNRGVDSIWTRAGQGEGSPVTFYERYGFKRTGDLHGNEVLLRLEIS